MPPDDMDSCRNGGGVAGPYALPLPISSATTTASTTQPGDTDSISNDMSEALLFAKASNFEKKKVKPVGGDKRNTPRKRRPATPPPESSHRKSSAEDYSLEAALPSKDESPSLSSNENIVRSLDEITAASSPIDVLDTSSAFTPVGAATSKITGYWTVSPKEIVYNIDLHYSKRLPEVNEVFPWMHGVHERNICQLAFLDPRKRFRDPLNQNIDITKAMQELDPQEDDFKVPSSTRTLVIMKVGAKDDEYGLIVGSVHPAEVLVENVETRPNYGKEHETDSVYDKMYSGVNEQLKDDAEWMASEAYSDSDSDLSDSSIAKEVATEDLKEEDTPPKVLSNFEGRFLFLDPETGINLRNFHIQVAKWATVADIIVYFEDPERQKEAQDIAHLCVLAQKEYAKHTSTDEQYRTFLCPRPCVNEIFQFAPHCVSMPSRSFFEDSSYSSSLKARSSDNACYSVATIDGWKLRNWDRDFWFHERVEMSMMSSATPLEHNVWVGNAEDFQNWVESLVHATGYELNVSAQPNTSAAISELTAMTSLYVRGLRIDNLDPAVTAYINDRMWATFINCCDRTDKPSLANVTALIKEYKDKLSVGDNVLDGVLIIPLPYGFGNSDKQLMGAICELLYLRSQMVVRDSNGAIFKNAGALISCSDGYTESSVPALAFLIYSCFIPAHKAFLDMHLKYKRSFFCFKNDITFLMESELYLMNKSPTRKGSTALTSLSHHQQWFCNIDGSLPSQILPHMYLGSLSHADNVEMLQKLGIKRVLSVGERPEWDSSEDNQVPNKPEVLYIDNVQDDGVDFLGDLLTQCLNFLNEGYKAGEATLVHCRVGVSRSATVCIAEVMRKLGVGLPRAYLFVRVRRLNVIIQPNLKLMYELLKWEEYYRGSSQGWLREVDWHIFCREVALLNRHYIS